MNNESYIHSIKISIDNQKVDNYGDYALVISVINRDIEIF